MPRAQVMRRDAESGKMTIHKDGLMTFPVQGYLSGKSQHTGCAVCHSPLSGQEPLGQDRSTVCSRKVVPALRDESCLL